MKKIIYNQEDPVCACRVSLDLLGDRWSLIIVRDLFRNKNSELSLVDQRTMALSVKLCSGFQMQLLKWHPIEFRFLF